MMLKKLVFLALAAFLALFLMGLAPAPDNQEEFQKTLPLSPQGTFKIGRASCRERV